MQEDRTMFSELVETDKHRFVPMCLRSPKSILYSLVKAFHGCQLKTRANISSMSYPLF